MSSWSIRAAAPPSPSSCTRSVRRQVRRVDCAGRGIARAMNHGSREVRHDTVLVTHDDCVVADDWVGVGAAAGRVRTRAPSSPDGSCHRSGRAYVPSTKSDPQPQDFTGIVTSGVLFPADMVASRHAAAGDRRVRRAGELPGGRRGQRPLLPLARRRSGAALRAGARRVAPRLAHAGAARADPHRVRPGPGRVLRQAPPRPRSTRAAAPALGPAPRAAQRRPGHVAADPSLAGPLSGDGGVVVGRHRRRLARGPSSSHEPGGAPLPALAR